MMTGVTKLTKLLIFSGLNHLKDRTMDPRFATLLGYTPDELDGALRENTEVFAQKNGMDFAAAKRALLSWYDGYRFSPESEAKVCNPVSLGNALESGSLKNYGNPWLVSSLPVFYVGVNYDPEKRGIDDPLVEGKMV